MLAKLEQDPGINLQTMDEDWGVSRVNKFKI